MIRTKWLAGLFQKRTSRQRVTGRLHKNRFAEALEIRTLLAANPIAPQFLATETVALAESPAVVAVAEGTGNGFVSAWTSYEQAGGDTSGLGVYAQRFMTDGSPNGSAFLVNTGYTDGDQNAPDIAIDGSGKFIVVWESPEQDGDGLGVYAQRYLANGTPAEPAFKVNEFTDGDQSSPSVAMDNSGRFVIAWQSFEQDGDGYGVYARRYAANGTAQEANEFLVNTVITAGNQLAPSVSVASSNGNFVIAWEGDVVAAEESVEVLAHLYNSSGGTIRDEFQVNATTPRGQVTPDVAMDANGDFVVAWMSEGQVGSGSDIFAQRFDNTGTTAGPEYRVNETTLQGQVNPAVGVDDDGDYMITWQSSHQDEFSWGIFGRTYSSTGAVLTNEYQVNTFAEQPQTNPGVGVNSQGDAVVIWQGLDDTHAPAVHAQRYALPNGGSDFASVGDEVVLSNYIVLEESSASVAVDADRNFVVVWQSYGDDGSGQSILARRFDAVGAPIGDAFVVNTTANGNQSNPAVASDAAGNFTVVWESTDQDGDGHGIFAQQFDMDGNTVGSEFQVNSVSVGSQTRPTIAMNATDGSFVVVWEGPDGGGSGIFAQRFNADATLAGTEFAVNTFTQLDQVSPAVSMNAAGQFVVGWVSDHRFVFDPEDSEKSIFVQWFDASGVATGDEQLAHSINPDAEAQEYPDVAIDSNGDFVAVWQSITQDGSAWGVYGRQFLADKTPVQPVEFLVNQTTEENQRQATVAGDADGNFVVTWQSDLQDQSATAIMSRQFLADGSAATDESLVNTWELGPQILPVVAMTPTGDFGIFWNGQGNSRKEGIHGRIYEEGYVPPPPHIEVMPLGNQFLVHSSAGPETSSPAVAVIESSGNYVAAWASFEQPGADESGQGIYVQRFFANGSPRSDAVLVNSAHTNDDQNAPGVAVDAAGNFVVVWESLGQDGDGFGVYAQRYQANGNPVGTAFKVNEYTMGDQNAPSVAMDNAGNFVIAWQSMGQDGDGYGVYARRYSAAGVALDMEEFRVNTDTMGNQLAPSVARARTDGRFIVTWQAEVVTVVAEEVEVEVEILARIFDGDGSTLKADFQVNSISEKEQVTPAVAMDPDGDFVVAWTTDGLVGSGADVFMRQFSAAGVGVTEDIAVNVTTRRGQQNPAVAIDGDGDVIVTWESSHQDGFSWGIFGQIYDTAGNALFTEEFQVNSNTQGPQIRPVANANSDGTAIVLWLGLDATHHPAVHAQRYLLPQPSTEFSVGPEGEVVLNNYSGFEEAPAAVAVDEDGNFVTVWQSYGDDGSGLGVFGQLLDPLGNPVGDAFPVATTTVGNQSYPDVACDANGNFTVVWQAAAQDGDGYGVFARQFAADGTPLTDEFQVNSTTAGNQGVPSIAMNSSNGAFVVVWQGPDAEGLGIFGQRFTSTGQPVGDEFQLNTFTDLDQVSPSVSMNTAGQSVVVWVSDHRAVFDPTDTEKTIFGQWFDADGNSTGAEFLVHSIQPEYEAQEYPDVAISPNGDFTVVFQSINQDGNTWGVFARQFLADKTAVQPIEFQVNQTVLAPQRHASIVSDAQGNFVIAWQSHSQDASATGVYARLYDSDGVAQTDEFLVPTYEEGPQTSPVMAMTPDGDFGVFWTGHGVDRVEGVNGRVFMTQRAVMVDVTGPASAVREGEVVEFVVSLSEPATEAFTVALSLEDGTATLASGDFDAVSAPGILPTVSFAPGEQTKIVRVSTNADGIKETAETFTLSVAAVFGAGAAGSIGNFATATIEGDQLQVAPIPDQTIAADTGVIDLVVATSSSTAAPAILTTGTLPGFVSFVDSGDGTGVFTFNPTAGDIGDTEITLTATDANGAVSETFTLSVVAADVTVLDSSIHRINTGDGAVGTFQADAFFNTGKLYKTSAAIDMTQVPGLPMAMFQSTRYDVPTDPELHYSIPVTPGEYQVNLYFAEIYSRAFAAGSRVFDVSIEGSLVLDNFDVFAAAGGGNRGIVRSFVVNSDSSIDIDFGHVTENPDIMGIEIIQHSMSINNGPEIAAVLPVSLVAGTSSMIPVSASDPDGDTITLAACGLPAFASFVDNGNGTGSIVLNPSATSHGEYAITVQAMSGSQPLSDSTSFILNVTPAPGDPGAVDPPIDGSVTVGGTVTATTGVRIDGPSAPVAEGDMAVFTISLAEPAASKVTVLLSLDDGSASLASGDFAPLSYDGFGTAIQFLTGQQAKQVSVRVNHDSVNEADETFSLTIVEAFGTTIESGHSTATATISGASLLIGPTPDQTIAAGTGPVQFVVAANSTDGGTSALMPVDLPSYATFVDRGDGTATITFNPTGTDIGSATVSFSATDSNTSVTRTFIVTVLPADVAESNESIIRLNAGDGAVGTFAADQYANTGRIYTTSATIDVSDASLPVGTPAAIFQTTRYDVASGAELSYDIPVVPGVYEVRLFFAEIYAPAFRVGGRVFDVAIEGQTVLDNLDVFAEVGGNKGVMKTFVVTTADAKIDIDFSHVVENPNIMGIEIIDRSTTTNTGPVIAPISAKTATVGSLFTIPVTAMDADAGDMITLTVPDLPSFATFVDNGNGTGVISINASAGDVGDYPISVQAESGDQSLTDLEGFLLAIDDLLML